MYITSKKLNYNVIFGPSILFPVSKEAEWIIMGIIQLNSKILRLIPY
jgi:hypothetical protein